MNSEQGSDNRREFSRVKVELPVRLRGNGLTEEHCAFLLDISMNGICIDGKTGLPEGSFCSVEIVLDSQQRIQIHGRVVRSGEGRVSVAFEELSLESMQHLRNLVLYNASPDQPVEQEVNESYGIRRKYTLQKD